MVIFVKPIPRWTQHAHHNCHDYKAITALSQTDRQRHLLHHATIISRCKTERRKFSHHPEVDTTIRTKFRLKKRMFRNMGLHRGTFGLVDPKVNQLVFGLIGEIW